MRPVFERLPITAPAQPYAEFRGRLLKRLRHGNVMWIVPTDFSVNYCGNVYCPPGDVLEFMVWLAPLASNSAWRCVVLSPSVTINRIGLISEAIATTETKSSFTPISRRLHRSDSTISFHDPTNEPECKNEHEHGHVILIPHGY